MLTESRLFSFLDSKNGFALHFLDGQKLIHDLALIHSLRQKGFAYFRDVVLSTLPLICFLKPGESLGIYIDSSDPFFRLKIETNQAGYTRTLLLPEEFELFPEKITGTARVTKLFPFGKSPYTSVIQFTEAPTDEIINRVLRESYQAHAEIVVSEESDQSLILIKLPPVNVNSQLSDETPSLHDYAQGLKPFLGGLFKKSLSGVQDVVAHFEATSFSYLSSRQVELFCPCSKERMQDNLRMLYLKDPEALFDGKDTLEAKCDYCKKTYVITRDDLKPPFGNMPFN